MNQTEETKNIPPENRPMRAEIILALLAVVIMVGWVFRWADPEGTFDLFQDTFAGLSFFGCLLIVVYVIVKAFGAVTLPPKIETKVLPILSLVPVIGYLLSIVWPLHTLLTVGGSIALAYISAITYWKRQFLRIAGTRLDENETVTPPAPGTGESPRASDGSPGGGSGA